MYIFYTLLLVILVVSSDLSFRKIMGYLLRLTWFIIIVLIFQVISIYYYNTGNNSSINFQFLFILKLVYLSAFSLLILSAITPVEIIDCFTKYNNGFNYSINKIFMFIILSYTPKLISDARKLKVIALSRGISVGNNPLKYIKRFTIVLIPLIVCALQYSRKLTDLMILRGYAVNNKKRSPMNPVKIKWQDYSLILSFLIVLILLVYYDKF